MEKRILFITKFANGIATVTKYQEEGYDVIVHIAEPFLRDTYDGFIKKDDNLDHMVSTATRSDLVVFDCTGLGTIGDKLRAKGIPVYGGQTIADMLEENRYFGLKVAQKCGMKVPYTVRFTKRQDGINFLKKNPAHYVYKACGSGLPSAKTFIAHDAAEMISHISSEKKDEEYILQLFIEGLEYSTEMFFSQGNPVEPSFHTLEDKRAYSGELGPNTGSMSALQIADNSLNNKMVKEGIGRCFDWLKKVKYTGNLDANTIIDKQGNLWFIEWTARDGWNSSYARNVMLNEPLSMLYEYIAKGEAKKVELKKGMFGMDILVAIPPFPLESCKETEKYFNPLARLSGGKKVIVNKVHPDIVYNFCDVKNSDEGLITAGCDGAIVEVCTASKDIIKGREAIVSAIDDISLEDKFYRNDSFDRALEQLTPIDKAGCYDGPSFKVKATKEK